MNQNRLGIATVALIGLIGVTVWRLGSQKAEDTLAELVISAVGKVKSVADLFCGVGPFALRLAENARVYAADSDKPASEPEIAYVTGDAIVVERYLGTPDFGETIKELHNETLLMRIEVAQFTYPALGPLAGKTAREINEGKFDEPLRLIEDIVMTDQPYTKIVTADYTMTNAVTAAMWGMTHTGAAEAWTRSESLRNR